MVSRLKEVGDRDNASRGLGLDERYPRRGIERRCWPFVPRLPYVDAFLEALVLLDDETHNVEQT